MVTTRAALRAASAATDGRVGLDVDRFFTTEGVHPYDDIEWEHRDAVITDHQTGEVSFEQRDVEFPKSWSANATTIVAQKYFRGHLGTPQRESSVRHMIDRVADTITRWGVQGAYFADDDAAQAFNHELKHLLVTQKAAFNSPVWFNVGVEERPQASACFILSVEDQMSSILNWYYDEGVIFKGGSGAGVNLSRIRSSKEKLRGGGEASGPVSFMRGADASAGTIKCLHADSDVVTDRGVRRIADVRDGDRVLTRHGFRDVAAVHDNGEREVVRVRTELGDEIVCTPEHRFWVRGRDGEGWREAGHLRDDDALLLDLSATDYGSPQPLESVDAGHHNEVAHDLPTTLDEDLALSLGLAADLDRVPDAVWSSPTPVRTAFLTGVFETHGDVVGDRPVVSSLNQPEALTVHRLLLSVGLPSRISTDEERLSTTGDGWSVRIVGCDGARQFAKTVGFVSQGKIAALQTVLEQEAAAAEHGIRSVSDVNIDVVDPALPRFVEGDRYYVRATVEAAGTAPVIDLTVDDVHEYLVHGLVTHNSGGKTRRAAKMVILDVDHPDVEEFIWCKRDEEQKVRALEAAGYDMSFDSKNMSTVQYQNANNSVRVDDDFMRAVENDEEYALVGRTDGEVKRTVKARELMRQISQAAWECADPGLQYDTTVNDWHTTPNAGRINGSNPCFTGDSLVHTDKGLVRFDELLRRVQDGEGFGIYTHDATNADEPSERLEVTSPDAFMITGRNPVVRLRFSNGMELRCTPQHKIFTTNRGYVAAEDLTSEDRVKTLNLSTPAAAGDVALPVEVATQAHRAKGDHAKPYRLPEKWTKDLAHYLGYHTGDGSMSGSTIATIYGTDEEQSTILPRHRELLTWLNGDTAPTPSRQENGTQQLRLSRKPLARFFTQLGMTDERATNKRVPWSVFRAMPEIVAEYLRGLFDVDDSAGHYVTKGTRIVTLGSSSEGLLQDVQVLLSSFGILSTIYPTTAGSEKGSFSYTRKDGSDVTYSCSGQYQLRITGSSLIRFAREIGFSLPSKADRLRDSVDGYAPRTADETIRLAERTDDGFELTYNLSEPRNHSYIVNGVVVRNCSEYMHLDNSACNLASLNLRKFEYDGVFDTEAFTRAVEIMFTAQEIIVSNSSYPTDPIAENAKAYRQLGLGYANLGGLLMSRGIAYDSDEGRAWAGAITALMTGHAYRTSAELARVKGPFEGYAQDSDGMLRVLRKHRDALEQIEEGEVPANLLQAAQRAWDEAVQLGSEHGVRNAQASVLAPTGCLVGGSLVPTERGLVRLSSLGDPGGRRWQDLDVGVATDDGPRRATHFYVNGTEAVVTVDTAHGHRIQGTPAHRIRVVRPDGAWAWKRVGDLEPGERVPLAFDQLVGERQTAPLPALGRPVHTDDRHVETPAAMTAELAELAGYSAGAGSADDDAVRLRVAPGDFDVVDHLARLGKELFDLEAQVSEQDGATEIVLASASLARWWKAAGFAPAPPQIPEAVLRTNDRSICAAFLRGLFEAEATVRVGYPEWVSDTPSFSHEVQTLLLALGYPTTRRVERAGDGVEQTRLRLLNSAYHAPWLEEIGFLGDRKTAAVETRHRARSATYDRIPVTRELIDRAAPTDGWLRTEMLAQHRRHGAVSRRYAAEAQAASADAELGSLLGFFYDEVHAAELGEDELTYDLSVPDNVTYVADGFVSHNTIGLMMDCDTTGVEPDLGLVKVKKLVGGGTMRIVNQTVPAALEKLGYQPEQVEAIVDYIDKHSTIEGAPGFREEHLPVFDCAMGERSIAPMGHVRMMGAVQPFISGALSKTVNLPESATVEDVQDIYLQGWKLGLKAIAIYRDNCKVAQPLAIATSESTDAEATSEPATTTEQAADHGMVRRRLPKQRPSQTLSFMVGDAEGYLTAGEYPGDGLGEIFVKLGKQGSTLSGVMDAFAISVSLGLQYGVPLEAYVSKFTNMRFDPSGMTDDPEVKFSSSIVDYIFRRLAIEYLPAERRHQHGIYTIAERKAQLDAEHGVQDDGQDEPVADAEGQTVLPIEKPKPVDDIYGDAPMCFTCGVQMVRSGSCHVCQSCGSTSGCS